MVRISGVTLFQMNFVDNYWNVTLDSVFALKLALSASGPQLEFVLLGDDDSYLNVPALWTMLYVEREVAVGAGGVALPLDKGGNFLLGSLFDNAPPLRPEANDTRTYVDRAVTPTYMFAGEHFPDFLSGSMYVIPAG